MNSLRHIRRWLRRAEVKDAGERLRKAQENVRHAQQALADATSALQEARGEKAS